MSNVINNTGDSELNESPQGFINSDAFDDNDTLNLVNEFPCLNEDSTIFQGIELHSKKNLTDCNIKKQETISSSLYEKFENIYLGQKRKKKKNIIPNGNTKSKVKTKDQKKIAKKFEVIQKIENCEKKFEKKEERCITCFTLLQNNRIVITFKGGIKIVQIELNNNDIKTRRRQKNKTSNDE